MPPLIQKKSKVIFITNRLRASLFAFLVAMVLCSPTFGQDSASPSSKAVLDRILKETEKQAPTEATLKQLQDILEKEPKNYYAHLVMGNALDRVALPAEAMEQYKIAVELGPDSPRAFIELVKAQINLGQQDAAMHLLDSAHRKFPKDPEVTFWVGNYFLTKGDIKKAEEYYDLAKAANPKLAGMGAAFGEVRLKEKRYAEAIAMADTDLKNNHVYPMANAVKGLALYKLHRYSEAVEPLRLAFNEFGRKPDFAKNYAEACYISHDYKEALEPAMVAVAADQYNQDNNVKWLLIGVVSRLPAGYIRERVPPFSDKLDLIIPKNSNMHFVYGDIFDGFGYHDLAAREFHKSFQLDPSRSQAAYRLANDLQMYFQKYDEAKFFLSKAHSLDPNNVEIADRLTRLEMKLPMRDADLAWKLKDLLRKQRSPI